MPVPVPAIQYANVFEELRDLGIVQIGKRSHGKFRRNNITSRRCVPGLNGGALPRTPHSFRLSMPRFAGRQIGF